MFNLNTNLKVMANFRLEKEYHCVFKGAVLSRVRSPLPESKNLVSGLYPSVSEKCLFLNQVLRENKQ